MSAPAVARTSAYPPAVADLLPRAQAWATELGHVPSQNRIKTRFKVGTDKARELRTALLDTPSITPAEAAPTEPAAVEPVTPPPTVPADEPRVLTAAPAEPAEPATRRVEQLEATPPATAAQTRHEGPAKGAGLFYLVSAAAMLISINTSWRYFGQRLHINGAVSLAGHVVELERGAMFAVLELAMLACGWAMRANVRRTDTPGPARLLAWALCGMAGYMAIALSGPWEGIARVALGPVLALISLHLALGIEVRVRRGTRHGTWARVLGEMRERALSRLGLGDDSRDALARTRDRAADRAARLATTRYAIARKRRLARAVRMSGASLDPGQRDRLTTQVAALRHLDDLVNVDRPSPWQ